jgi:hypothetical protein
MPASASPSSSSTVAPDTFESGGGQSGSVGTTGGWSDTPQKNGNTPSQSPAYNPPQPSQVTPASLPAPIEQKPQALSPGLGSIGGQPLPEKTPEEVKEAQTPTQQALDRIAANPLSIPRFCESGIDRHAVGHGAAAGSTTTTY